MFYWGPFSSKVDQHEQIGVYCAHELMKYIQTVMWNIQSIWIMYIKHKPSNKEFIYLVDIQDFGTFK